MAKKSLKIDPNSQNTEQWDDTFRLMSWWKAEDVAKATVMVVGAGALGNEVLKNLALLNVGNIFIVDFDTIEYSNLCRSILYRPSDAKSGKLKSQIAAERIKEINPNINVQYVNGDIMIDVGLGVFRKMDVIIGCLDNRIARLFINKYAFKVNRTWIDGAIENLSGQLTIYQPTKSCYECRLTESDWSNIRFKLGCADIAKRNSTQGRVPTTPISASIIAAMQVQEALKIIHHNYKHTMTGQQFKYDGMNNWMFAFDLEPIKEECDSHYSIKEDELVLAEELSCTSTIAETLAWLERRFDTKQIEITLNYKIVLEITTLDSNKSYDIIIAEPHFTEKMQLQYQVEAGENIGFTKYTSVISNKFPDLNVPLSQVGVPPLQILTVETDKDIYFVELAGDKDYLKINSNN